MKRRGSVRDKTSTPKAVAAPTKRGRQRWLLYGTVLLVVGVGIWYWWPSTPTPIPPIPGDVRDSEVLRAIGNARQKVENEPRSASTWGELGMTLLALQYEAEADTCFAEAARLDPGTASWPYFRGIHALRYDPERAVPFLRQAVAGHCPSEYKSALRLRLAEALLEQQELNEAEKLFRQDWQGQTRNPRAAFGLGLIAQARGEDQLATDLLTAARESTTARKPATAQLALLARNRGDIEAATRFEQEAAALPGGPPTWPDPLIEQMSRLQVGPQKHMLEFDGIEQQRGIAEAAQTYLRELEKQPSTRAYLGAGLNLARMQQFDRAMPLLREAVRRDPDNCETHYVLAQAFYLQAERDRKSVPDSTAANKSFRHAAQAAAHATERKPDHAGAYLLWGRALIRLRDFAAAVGPLKKGVACRPEVFNLQLALGEALLETGDLLEAETHLENARKLAPKDPRPDQALERLRKKRA